MEEILRNLNRIDSQTSFEEVQYAQKFFIDHADNEELISILIPLLLQDSLSLNKKVFILTRINHFVTNSMRDYQVKEELIQSLCVTLISLILSPISLLTEKTDTIKKESMPFAPHIELLPWKIVSHASSIVSILFTRKCTFKIIPNIIQALSKGLKSNILNPISEIETMFSMFSLFCPNSVIVEKSKKSFVSLANLASSNSISILKLLAIARELQLRLVFLFASIIQGSNRVRFPSSRRILIDIYASVTDDICSCGADSVRFLREILSQGNPLWGELGSPNNSKRIDRDNFLALYTIISSICISCASCASWIISVCSTVPKSVLEYIKVLCELIFIPSIQHECECYSKKIDLSSILQTYFDPTNKGSNPSMYKEINDFLVKYDNLFIEQCFLRSVKIWPSDLSIMSFLSARIRQISTFLTTGTTIDSVYAVQNSQSYPLDLHNSPFSILGFHTIGLIVACLSSWKFAGRNPMQRRGGLGRSTLTGSGSRSPASSSSSSSSSSSCSSSTMSDSIDLAKVLLRSIQTIFSTFKEQNRRAFSADRPQDIPNTLLFER
ncbi:hypothetical protein ADUPG1_007950, partial [Aduncisulcus paluster]